MSNDRALVAAVRKGNLRAFELLVQRYQAALIASACHMIRQREDAQDLAQEALIEAYRRLDQLHDGAKFRGWLFAILRNKCLRYLENRRQQDVPLEDGLTVAASQPIMDDAGLTELLGRLPLPDREILAARYFQELGYDEIAEMLGISIPAAHVRCSRARERLRALLVDTGEAQTRRVMRRALEVIVSGGIGASFANRIMKEVSHMQAHTLPSTAGISLPAGAAGKSLAASLFAALAGWKVAAGIAAVLVIAGAGLTLHARGFKFNSPKLALTTAGNPNDRSDTDPVVNIPTPVMPNPNAYDYYLQAANGLKQDIRQYPNLPDIWDMQSSDVAKVTPDQKEAIVAATEYNLDIVRQGFSYPYQPLPNRSFGQAFPEYNQFRWLATDLQFAAEVKAAHGDWDGAMSCCLDALHLGKDMPHGATLIGLLVGLAIQSSGRDDSWQAVDQLTAPQARAAARRLETIIAGQASFADTYQEQKWAEQAGLMEVFQAPDWRSEFARISSGDTTPDAAMLALLQSRTKQQIMRMCTDGFDAEIAQAQRPYMEQQDPVLPEDKIGQLLVPVYARKASLKYTVTQTENGLLLIRLALRAYQAEHGSYPASLEKLTPTYLAQIPSDSFAATGPLQYKVQGKQYLLYSIGPDGKDDGGKPIDQPQPHQPEYARYNVSSVSKGDIVAGINPR